MEKLTVDRIEGEIIYAETADGDMVTLDISRVEGRPSDGDIMILRGERWYIDRESTACLRRSLRERLRRLAGR
ncbi:MAG: DUF3006 family protein [Clostridiales bacterium]|nr:DUF3006 family protein [Clostridiales bacterium]